MSSSEIYAATVAEKKMLVLRSFEGELFQVEEKVAAESQTIRALIEDDCADSVIPLPNVTAPILAKVIVYCKYHLAAKEKDQVKVVENVDDNFVYNVADKVVDSDLKKFDEEFVKVDQDTLFDLLLAANYLNIQSLFDLTTQTVADMMKGKTPEEIRTTFNIENDYTPEEEEEVRRENAWAFE